MHCEIHREVAIQRTPRVLQVEGIFDLTPEKVPRETWAVDLPIEGEPWQIGLIVGPSGSGKSTLAAEAFPGRLFTPPSWPADRSVVDAFPHKLSVKEVTGILSSVGFSSPPAWLRPFRCLSNGEQFRVNLAYAIAAADGEPVVFDEFTSVVDRTVAKIGSAAVAKAIRKRPGMRFVAVTCHDDVEEWLQPDWVARMPGGEFTRRLLRRRPDIRVEIVRLRDAKAWEWFRRHHYLNHDLQRNSYKFLALVEGRPAAFASALHYPHPSGGWYREHRTVCLPDFQGVGLGNALSEAIASAMACLGKPYRSTTSHPAMIAHRTRSPLWRMIRRLSVLKKSRGGHLVNNMAATRRPTASFQYVGKPRPDLAAAWGLKR